MVKRSEEPAVVGFILDIDEDGWPPASSEWLRFSKSVEGFELVSIPLFASGLSVGDLLQFSPNADGFVGEWRCIRPSERSVIWVMAFDEDVTALLSEARDLGCGTESLPPYNYHAIDVPGSVDIEEVESVLSRMNDRISLAYPSLRHSV